MAYQLKFVDSISTSATTRLDLNDGTLWRALADGTSMPPPPLQRSAASSLLAEGASYPASAYENRTITVAVRLDTSSEDTAALELQKLARELERPPMFPGGPNNFLKWQPDTTNPVFFRTFRSDFNELRWNKEDHYWQVTIMAEPFAYAPLVSAGSFTVNNDPAAGSNGLFLDVSGLKGDVETPAVLRFTGTTAATNPAGEQVAFAVRRRGTPSNTPHLIQAESMAMAIADTTVQVNDAAMSGAGNNYIRTTFATSASLVTRATVQWPGTANVDGRGQYRVLAVVRRNTSTSGVVQARIAYGATPYFTDIGTVTVPTATGSRFMLDMGLIPVPPGYDPTADFGATAGFTYTGMTVYWQASRSTGTATLDLDYLLFLPADDRLMFAEFSPGSGNHHWVDGPQNMIYMTNTAGTAIQPADPPPTLPAQLLLTPGSQTNRVFMLKGVKPSTANTKTDTLPVTVSYYPRYLKVAPVST